MRRLPSHPDPKYPPNRAAAAYFVRRRTPSRHVWLEYEEAVDAYVLDSPYKRATFRSPRAGTTEAELDLAPSRVFGRNFLVAWVEDPWLREHSGGMDAIAETRALHGWSRPPVVMAPASRRASKSRRFKSILEHEFVHICQGLSGLFIEDGSGREPSTPDELVSDLYRRTLVEFEAHFIQWVNWPELNELKQVRQVNGVLDRFCLLKAYRARVEEFFAEVATGRVPVSVLAIHEFLEIVPHEAERHLAPLRLSKGSLRWLMDRWPYDVAQILFDLDRSLIARCSKPAMNAAILWANQHPVLEKARRRASRET